MSPPCRFLKVCEEATRNPSSCEAKNAKFLHFPQPILWSKYYWRKTALSDILYWKKIVPKPRQRTLSAPSQRLENSISRFDRRPTCPAATTGCYGPPLCIRPIARSGGIVPTHADHQSTTRSTIAVDSGLFPSEDGRDWRRPDNYRLWSFLFPNLLTSSTLAGARDFFHSWPANWSRRPLETRSPNARR